MRRRRRRPASKSGSGSRRWLGEFGSWPVLSGIVDESGYIRRCRVAFALDESTNFGEVGFAGRFHGESVQGELHGGSGEETVAEVLQDLALHRVLAERGPIYVS